MRQPSSCFRLFGVTLGAATALAVYSGSARGQTYSVVHQFDYPPATDPAGPGGKLFLDVQGNLLGTTGLGGEYNTGTVFSLSQDGVFTGLHSVSDFKYHGSAAGGVIADKSGNIYGTTYYTLFGFGSNQVQQSVNIDPVLGPHAENTGGLAFTTGHSVVGASSSGGAFGGGTVFIQRAGKKLAILHSFGSGTDGVEPSYGGLTADATGNIYGATSAGGPGGYGIIYKLTPSGVETVLHSFSLTGNGCIEPNSGLALDQKGNVYGTTFDGGGGRGCVFEITPSGIYTVLYVFPFSASAPTSENGLYPNGSLSRDSQGNLYGTTHWGGPSGLGVVFKFSPSGRETILHAFTGGSDGNGSGDGVTVVPSGKVFGVAGGGTSTYGLIFSITP